MKRFQKLIERLAKEPRSGESERAEKALEVLDWTVAALVDIALLEPTKALQRADLEADLTLLRDPDAFAAALARPADRERLVREWRQVLDSPLSPVPLAEAVLADSGWDELELSAGAVLDAFEARLDELEVQS